MLNKATTEELREILRNDYNLCVNQKEASEIAYNLLYLFDNLARLDAKDKQDDFKDVARESRTTSVGLSTRRRGA